MPTRFVHRPVLLCVALLGVASFLAAADKTPPLLPETSPSVLESTPEGWTDLLTDSSLGDWQRAPFPAGKPLSAVNPWSFDPSGPVLRCEAAGIHEMLLHRTPKADGVLHVEWRYIGTLPKPNSGVFVRTAPDASAWFQAQLASSGLGTFFGTSPDSDKGKPIRHAAGFKHPELQRPAGEWNVLEITCRGDALSLWLNGRTVATLTGCPTPSGHVGFEAEFTPIEFRRVLFRPLP